MALRFGFGRSGSLGLDEEGGKVEPLWTWACESYRLLPLSSRSRKTTILMFALSSRSVTSCDL